MNELIKKFFQDELTESEEQALAELLKNSVETALEFGNTAAETYTQFGLPEPQRPGHGGSGPSRSKYGAPLLILGILTVSAVLGGFIWKKFHTPVPLSLASPTEKSSALIHQQESQNHPKKALPLKTGLEAMPPLLESGSPTAFKVKIVVRQPAFGPVTVQVLDSRERQARLLYANSLKPGRWGFEWDGRLNDGKLADPGKYQIQVLAGTTLQKQDVLIKPLKKP